MRNKPITLELDRHGDPIMPDSKSELAELASSARKDPRYSRMLARSAKALLIALTLAGCTTTQDPHEFGACTLAQTNGTSVSSQCDAACVGVALDEPKNGTGPTCNSTEWGRVTQSLQEGSPVPPGYAVCHPVAADDGSMGCCAIVDHARDPRVTAPGGGWEFFACDGGQ